MSTASSSESANFLIPSSCSCIVERLVEPAEPLRLVFPGPDGGVALPDPLDEVVHAAIAFCFTAMPSRISANESANFCTPSCSSVSDDVVVVDARLGEILEELVRLVDALHHRVAAHLAVILERLDRLERHRVHGVGPDELLDVHRVAVGGVLRRGRRPQRALRPRALALQVLPALALERLAEVLVRELRVRDRELALELRVAERLEPLVGLGVDARDEERRDGADLRRVAAAGDEPLEPAEVRLDDGLVAVEREDERDVDRRAVRDAVLDRRQAGLASRGSSP